MWHLIAGQTSQKQPGALFESGFDKVLIAICLLIGLCLTNVSCCGERNNSMAVTIVETKGNTEGSVSTRTWERTYGAGTAESIQQTTDGCYIVAGSTQRPNVGTDVWLMKLGLNGNQVWRRTFKAGAMSFANWVEQTVNGRFILAGSVTYPGTEDPVPWLVLIDKNGTPLWQKIYPKEKGGQANYVQEDADGGYIFTSKDTTSGAMHRKTWLVRTDPQGTVLWQKTIGVDTDWTVPVKQTKDGGFIIAVCKDVVGYEKGILIKTDPLGNVLWSKSFGNNPVVASIQQTKDGGFVVVSMESVSTDEGQTPTSLLTVKTDPLGNVVQEKTIEKAECIMPGHIQQKRDGGYIVCGNTERVASQHSWNKVELLKADEEGRVLWRRPFSGEGSIMGNSVRETRDGGYMVAGESSASGSEMEAWIVKTDANGLVSPQR